MKLHKKIIRKARKRKKTKEIKEDNENGKKFKKTKKREKKKIKMAYLKSPKQKLEVGICASTTKKEILKHKTKIKRSSTTLQK